MADKRTILVTGASSLWGRETALQLSLQPGLHVIGLDLEPPAESLGEVQFTQIDFQSRKLVDLLMKENVGTVCHLAFQETYQPLESAFEFNVMGTIELLETCANAGVRQVVLKSTTAIYGAQPQNSAFLREDHPLQGSQHTGSLRDLIEIESFCNGYRLQHPEVNLCVLRFANIVGPKADTPMTRFLGTVWSLNLLGFDPRMQIIHENDVINALVHAVMTEASGTYNVAAQDSLPLLKMASLAGKPPAPMFHPLAYFGTRLLRGSDSRRIHFVPLEPDYIRYPWVGDLTKMREELGFTPHHSAEETLREFASFKKAQKTRTHTSPTQVGENHE